MNDQRLQDLTRRHEAGSPSYSCDHATGPCDLAKLTTELTRVRAWADFAYDLLDAHIWGFTSGDWQASEAIAHALEGDDWPPAWSLDPEDPARILVDSAVWPISDVGR